MDKDGVFSIKIEDFFQAVPATRAAFAYAGDPVTYLRTAFETVAREAAEDARKTAAGAERQLLIQPQGGGGWLHIGPADRVRVGDLMDSLADIDDEDGIEVDVRPMTPAEVDALPEFDGW